VAKGEVPEFKPQYSKKKKNKKKPPSLSSGKIKIRNQKSPHLV
jgi:hypothetical protein